MITTPESYLTTLQWLGALLGSCKTLCESQHPHQVFGAAAWGIVRFQDLSSLGSNIFSGALRKSDQVYQNLMENTLALNHKLDELIKSLKSLPKKTNEEDLAKHEHREKQDLGFENANFESQAPPSFDVYTPPLTYPEEVEETIGIPMEVEPFDQTQLEDVGLNTCSHDLFLSSREVPSVDEPEPQLSPNFSPLDVNLGDKRGTDPPIGPYSLGDLTVGCFDGMISLDDDSLELGSKVKILLEGLLSNYAFSVPCSCSSTP
ncbi:hypothetical protein Tco_0494703 [Tanacetum coccineum]